MDDFTVTSKGQVTIPRHVRQKLGIHAGSRVRFRIVGGAAQLEVVAAATPTVEGGFGMLRSPRRSVPADFAVATLQGKPRRAASGWIRMCWRATTSTMRRTRRWRLSAHGRGR